MKFEHPPGATPLDPDEIEGLLPAHITNQQQLNEWELANIVDGERWAFGRKHGDILSINFIRKLHIKMFGETWSWAGVFRNTEKNIGVAPHDIAPNLHDVCEDVKAQLSNSVMKLDEIAVRLSHRLVWIHPFPNGNGRFSRTYSDVLLTRHHAERFSWGSTRLEADSEVRLRYISALKAADKGEYTPLIEFARS